MAGKPYNINSLNKIRKRQSRTKHKAPQEEKMRAKMIQEYQPRQGLTASQKLIEQTYMSAQFEQLQQSAFFKLQEELVKIYLNLNRRNINRSR
jgi:hypothetical protein